MKIQKGLQIAGSVGELRRCLFELSRRMERRPDSPGCAAAQDDARVSTSTSAPARPTAVRMMYCDAVSYLPDDILCKVDRASMAVSLETRVPFLDHRVAELAARIPIEMKIRGGERQAHLRELLYRDVAARAVRAAEGRLRHPCRRMDQGPAAGLGGGAARPGADGEEGWFDPDDRAAALAGSSERAAADSTAGAVGGADVPGLAARAAQAAGHGCLARALYLLGPT